MNHCPFLLALAIATFSFTSCGNKFSSDDIWQISACPPVALYAKEGRYVAFCDAVKFEDRYYCVFREGENHAPYHEWHMNGYLKVFSSVDLKNWEEELEVRDPDWDLRDPCLCVAGNMLFLYFGYYSYETPSPDHKTGVVSLETRNGRLCAGLSKRIDIGADSNLWLWKVYYDNGYFYGTAYGVNVPLIYVTSDDGMHFRKVSEISERGEETSLVNLGDGRKVAIIRSVIPKGDSDVAISSPPYTKWDVFSLKEMIESPESFTYHGKVFVVGRSSYGMSLFLLDVDRHEVTPVYNFFAYGDYGDCGYPGVILEDNRLAVIYYAVNPDTEETCIFQTDLIFLND